MTGRKGGINTTEIIGSIKNSECNKTHLDIERAEDRGIIHRDYLAHMLRWTHAIKHCKYKCKVLDVGCGNGMLAQVLYVNKFRPDYVGTDIRKSMIEDAEKRQLHESVRFYCSDITKTPLDVSDNTVDLMVCFEVMEHIPEYSADYVLREMARCLKPDGVLLLSTPNYDGKHKAGNHIHEYWYDELAVLLKRFFTIENTYGTFASQKYIEPVLTEDERKVWSKLSEYYDSNMFSVLFAPLHAKQSRNILWQLKKL